jgi:hypothetical protein
VDRATAISDIQNLFGRYRSAQPGDLALLQALSDGKLYELYVLCELVDTLVGRGFTLSFPFTSLKFKAAPGMIKTSDPHFEMKSLGSSTVDWRIFVDIEFDTLGHHEMGAADNSRRHELDLVVTSATAGYPQHDEIALAVECKAVANFSKGLLKEALGVRRELSFYRGTPQTATLSKGGGVSTVDVRADPPSEFWLAFIDAKGSNYEDSPKAFGIELQHLEP